MRGSGLDEKEIERIESFTIEVVGLPSKVLGTSGRPVKGERVSGEEKCVSDKFFTRETGRVPIVNSDSLVVENGLDKIIGGLTREVKESRVG